MAHCRIPRMPALWAGHHTDKRSGLKPLRKVDCLPPRSRAAEPQESVDRINDVGAEKPLCLGYRMLEQSNTERRIMSDWRCIVDERCPCECEPAWCHPHHDTGDAAEDTGRPVE